MKKLFFSLFLTLTAFCVWAQDVDNDTDADPTQPRVDSILALITPDMSDTDKARKYSFIGSISDSPDTVLKYAQLSLDLCDKSDYKTIANNHDCISWAYYIKNEAKMSLSHSMKALTALLKLNDKPQIAEEYIAIAKCYHELNSKDSTFFYFNKALDIYTSLQDSGYMAYTYRSIGMVNSDFDFNEMAAEYLGKALTIDSIKNNRLDMADDYLYLALTEQNNSEKALAYLKKSVLLFDSTPTNDSYYIREKYAANQKMAIMYIRLANATDKKAYADSCYFYLNKIGVQNNSSEEIEWNIYTWFCYADYLSFCGKYSDALKVMDNCGAYLSNGEVNKTILTEYYKRLADIHKATGDYKNAMLCFEKMHEYKTAYANDSTLNVLASFQTEQAVKIHEAEKRELMSETRRLKTIRTSLIIGLVLVLSVVVLIFRMLIIRRKANEELLHKNQKLDQQNAEILAQREEIEAQRDVITNQWHEVDNINKKLIDSINYARRIQYAAISLKTEVDKVFPQNMVFYRPCDIVSGNFYRVAQCGKYRVLIIADCTGHGIPGAFLSMLGISALKEFCVTEEDAANPGTILDRMRNFIKSTLVSDLKDAIDDGMDMTICSFDLEAMEMRYAIANQTAFVIRDGEAIKLQGDRMPVGRYIIEKEHFTTQTIQLQKDDVVYCFSDGIQDQLGGDLKNEIGEKFLRRNLLAFLTANYTKPFDTQLRLLDKTITAWSNGRPQVDDMTLIGIRI